MRMEDFTKTVEAILAVQAPSSVAVEIIGEILYRFPQALDPERAMAEVAENPRTEVPEAFLEEILAYLDGRQQRRYLVVRNDSPQADGSGKKGSVLYWTGAEWAKERERAHVYVHEDPAIEQATWCERTMPGTGAYIAELSADGGPEGER